MSFEPDLAFLIRSGLDRLAEVQATTDGVRVTTHCMYPSNGLVRVYARGGINTVVVTDDGEAIGEALSAGIPASEIFDRTLSNITRDQGVGIRNGVLFTPPLPIQAAPIAILSVANAAKQVAEWLYDHAKIKRTRDFRAMLTEFLQKTFEDRVEHDTAIPGVYKPHKFANVISLEGNRKLIVDPVSPEASSINSRVVANLDVKAVGNPSILQRIVYDDDDEWSAADLNLLQMGATVIPFSRSREVIQRIVVGPHSSEATFFELPISNI
jgi:hypothetical protein